MDTTFTLTRQDPADPAPKMLRVNRFDHPTGHSLTQGRIELRRMSTREHENGKESMGRQLSHGCDERETVEIGHFQVGQEQVAGRLP